MESFSPIVKFLIELSEEANRIMLKYYSSAGISVESKQDMSPVTEADMEINRMVIARIKENYPDYEVLAEEISTNVGKSKNLFVIDPLDGTQMFAIGAPMFGFSAAVVCDGRSVAGVLSNPLAKRTLVAESGQGAYLLETATRIKVSDKGTLDKAFINTGWKDSRAAALLHSQGARTPVVYSVCESASLVALGGFDGAIFTGHFAHDIAAIKIIIEEVGGRVTDLNGNEQRYDRDVYGAIISNSNLYTKILEIVRESGIANDFPKNNK